MWTLIKNKRKDHTGVSPLVDHGITYTDPQDKTDLLANYFSSVFTTENTEYIPTLNSNPLPDIPSIVINPHGVQHLLAKLQTHKSGGPDNLPAYFLKEVSAEIAPALTMIFQASLNQGVLPHIWKSGAIVPVHKKGSRTECGNYRPISLTCICSKILEQIIVSNISDHLDAYHVLCNEQHGFRHRRCCESQLISTIDDFGSCLNEGGQCDVLFLDFSKAFDRVPHSRLLYKLNHYGIRSPLLKWLESFLTNRSQHVILNNCTSHETSVLSGVPQDTVLAPLLFLLYVNDLPQCVRNKIKLYADDVLYSVIHSEADRVRLQEDLKMLYQWSILWQMEFNPSKCEF